MAFSPMAQTVPGLDLQEASADPKEGKDICLSEDEAILGSGHVVPTVCDKTLEKGKSHLKLWMYVFKLHTRMMTLKNPQCRA